MPNEVGPDLRSRIFDIHRTSLRMGYRIWYGLTRTTRYVDELERTQWLPRDQLEGLQRQKLERLLDYAYHNIPYHRGRLEAAGYRPGQPFSLEQFRRIPVTTREDLQDNLQHLRASGVKGKLNHSGGSTGFPVTFYQDRNYRVHSFAELIRTFRMSGYEIGDPAAYLWGSDRDSRPHEGLFNRLRDRWGRNLAWINAFGIDEDMLYHEALKLVNFKPKLIVGYSSSLLMLANLAQERGIRGIEPIGIQSSGEILTQEMRQTIETTFPCRVFDRYGCREVGIIAHECSAHTGLHISVESNYVEFLDAEGQPVSPGEEGRIVATNLDNHAMPFIRYEIGDIGVPAGEVNCPCGRGLPLMDVVKGRMCDSIQAPSGGLLHPLFFDHLLSRVEGVRQFQVTQETLELLRVRIVPLGDLQQSSLDLLEEKIRRHGDPDFHIEFEICDTIETSPSGKYRFTISRVPNRLMRGRAHP